MPDKANTHTHKHLSKHKAIVSASMSFPFEWCALLVLVIFGFLIFSRQMIISADSYTEWLALVYFCVSIFLSVILFSRHQYKSIIIYSDRMVVRPVFFPFPRVYAFINLMRFELLETYSGKRLHYYIRMFDIDNRQVLLIKDNYPNYDKLLRSLVHSKLTYVGKIRVNWETRNAIRLILKWAAVLTPFLYGCILLLRVFNESA